MVVAYWIVAGLLALLFLFSGGMKVMRSRERLAPMMSWVDSVPMLLVRAIGVVEILGAIGLVLPPLTGIAPVLAVVAAAGLAVQQVLAAAFHVSRGEGSTIGLNVALVVLGAVAAWLATAF